MSPALEMLETTASPAGTLPVAGGTYLEGAGDLVGRLMKGIIRFAIWLMEVLSHLVRQVLRPASSTWMGDFLHHPIETHQR